jgi:excisionase family DNA binding protein
MYSRRPSEGDRALVVSPSRARELLDCGEARVYQLLKSGELKSFKDGKSRKILRASIDAYIERRLKEAEAGRDAWRGSSASEPVAISAAPTPK